MKLTALMAARNEDWIIGLSARVALMWCDALVVLNHASTDQTAAILSDIAAEHDGRVTILDEPNPAWNEMNHRQRMLDAARAGRATHIAYVDADEVLTGNLLPAIRDQIASLPPGSYLQCALPCIWPSLDVQRDDASPFGRAMTMLAFCDRAGITWKPKADGYQFHGREPHGVRVGARFSRSSGGVMHLQFAARKRLIAKHALYKMQETVRWPGRRTAKQIDDLYNLAPSEAGAIFAPVPDVWWVPYAHLMHFLDTEAEPWQAGECNRLWREHGPAKFAGLNLFGVIQENQMEEPKTEEKREPLTPENAQAWLESLEARGVMVERDVPEIEVLT